MIRVTENLRKIRDLLANSAIEANRDPAGIRLLAVSKKQPLEAVLTAATLGQRDFGENLVQEGIDKIAATSKHNLNWHFIGHLQTNKTRAVAEHFDWVHTVDRLKTAERLSRQRPTGRPPINICLQVNIDDEPAKSGIAVDAVAKLARAVSQLPNLELRGLMCLPRVRTSFDEQRVPFRRLHQLADAVGAAGVPMDTLSMGMTGDYRAAVFEGSTIVRIGTAIFGPRMEKQQTKNRMGDRNER